MICLTCGAGNVPGATICRVCGQPPDALPRSGSAVAEHASAPVVLPDPPPSITDSNGLMLAYASAGSGSLAWVLVPLGVVFAVGGLPGGLVISTMFLPVALSVVAVTTGHLARRDIEQGEPGWGYTLAGLILGYIQIVVLGLLLFGACVFFALTALLISAAGAVN